MACMHDKYRSFPTLDAFSRVFPATKPYNTAPTWRNVCFVSELVHTLPGGHIGHAHMLPKVGVISCMPPHAPCTSRTIRVCRRASLKEVFLAGPTKWSQTFCTPYHDHGMHVGGEFIHHGLIFVEIPLISMCITCKWACVKFIRWLEGQNINLSCMHKKIVYWMQVSMCII